MIQTIVLPNGLRIVCDPMPSVRSAAVGIWVGVGSRYEKHGEEGSAHFIEHMLFKGTKTSTAAELAAKMDEIGGQVNAFTSRDSTCFYARVLDTHLDRAVDMLSEMFFDSLFDENDVANERGVIQEEIDMYNDTPEDLVIEQLLGRVFRGALGKPVLGTASSLKKLTGESLLGFKAREYTPERIVISLAGSYTDADIARISDRFSVLRSPRPGTPRKCAYEKGLVLRRKATEQNHLCLAWPGLPEGSDDRFAWQVLSMVLGGGMASRLFQTVREKYGLCYSIGSFTSSYAETGMLGVSTAVGRESEEKAIRLILEEVRKLREDGITEAELVRAREQIKSGVILSMESTSNRMNRLGGAILQLGYCLTVDEVIERYDAVTQEAVLDLARQTLSDDVRSFSAVGRIMDKDVYAGILSES